MDWYFRHHWSIDLLGARPLACWFAFARRWMPKRERLARQFSVAMTLFLKYYWGFDVTAPNNKTQTNIARPTNQLSITCICLLDMNWSYLQHHLCVNQGRFQNSKCKHCEKWNGCAKDTCKEIVSSPGILRRRWWLAWQCCSTLLQLLISISTFARQECGGFWKVQRGCHTTNVPPSVPIYHCAHLPIYQYVTYWLATTSVFQCTSRRAGSVWERTRRERERRQWLWDK